MRWANNVTSRMGETAKRRLCTKPYYNEEW